MDRAKAALYGADLTEVGRAVQLVTNGVRMAEYRPDDSDEEQSESLTFLAVAFLLSLFLMFILLVTQFNSFYLSLLILSSVVMSTLGVILGLLLTQSTFNVVMTGVGIVALAGIVVNNNIVLIDTYNAVRNSEPQSKPRRSACARYSSLPPPRFSAGYRWRWG